ncbi:LCP family protein [Nocardia sp. NPDC049220]|uniref:LCP family protein n=1 Tax=Nocardia sp. NPDC049220 TaxID=3155273 RepID=UPI0033DC21EE
MPVGATAVPADDDTIPFARISERPRSAVPRHRRTDVARRRGAERHRKSLRSARIAAQLVAAASAVAIMAGTGFAWSAETTFDHGFTRTDAIGQDAPRSLGGDLNILLIGLDTRKDQDGNDLPQPILDQLHAGDGLAGGYNANSLILLHIPADMRKIVAFSIPRDDYVPVSGIPGYDHAKIKEAYGLKKAAAQAALIASGEQNPVTLEHAGREAGRASLVSTVRNLVGVPIDRFAEISLAGFYDLATALGGVDVCLNHAVDDSFYSGAAFPAGPQHLDGSEALAFVRQRHGLENGDLDRTHRQQAFLTSVAKSLKDSGTLTDITQLARLMDVAHRDVVLSGDWNLLDFARDLGTAGVLPVEFRTLPVLRYDTVEGQDVNIVDAAAIKKQVRAAFEGEGPQPTPGRVPTSTVDVHNAGQVEGRAAALSTALTARGYRRGSIGNGTYADGSDTAITYGPGTETDAAQLADLLGGLPATASPDLPPGHVEIVIGSDFAMPAELDTTPATPESQSSDSAAPTPDSGTPVTTPLGDSVPCVN